MTLQVTPTTKFTEADGVLTKDGFNALKALMRQVEDTETAEKPWQPDFDMVKYDLTAIKEFIGPSTRELIANARKLAMLASDQDFANYRDKQQIRTNLKSQYRNITAEYNSVITAATGPGSAIVQRLDTLEATIPDLASAEALTLLSAKVDVVEGVANASADAVTAVSATVGKFSASGLFRTSVEATPVGALSRIAISTSATGSGPDSLAAIYLDALSGGSSRAVLVANRVVIANPAGVLSALFDSGGAYFNSVFINDAYIKNLTVDNISIGGISTDFLAFGAITDNGTISTPTQSPVNSGATLASVTIENPAGNAVIFSFSGYVQSLAGGTTANTMTLRLRRGGTVIRQIVKQGTGSQLVDVDQLFVLDANPPEGTTTYIIDGTVSGVSQFISQARTTSWLYWKR